VKQRAIWNGTLSKCVLLNNRPTPTNLPGFYSLPSVSSCGVGWTSERSNAVYHSDCRPCPALIPGAYWVMSSFTCDWNCFTGQRLGGICIDSQNLARGNQEPLPWQAPGRFKQGVVVKTNILFDKQNELSKWNKGTNVTAKSLVYGRYNRHTIILNGTSIVVPGPICSYSLSNNGYVYVVYCNQSFIGYINLQDKKQQRFGVLIGNTTRGWQDGFRTEALFQDELYIAGVVGAGNLFVLDRWNCLLREVTVSTPGDYLTRVDTIYGLTTKFSITNTPKCYGGDSLAYPRQLWPMYGTSSLLCFMDDNGLYQLNMQTRGVTTVITSAEIGGIFSLESMRGCMAQDVFSVIVWPLSLYLTCHIPSTFYSHYLFLSTGVCLVVKWISDSTHGILRDMS